MDNHVFISYVHENDKEVQKLCEELTRCGVKVWLDRNDIEIGVDWQQAIRRAIHDGAFFIACFSKEYEARRDKIQEERITYMNEELTLAIDILRQRFLDQAWFIPVILNDCSVPDFDIGRGKTLQSLQYVELYKDWNVGVKRIVDVINPISPELQRLIEALQSEDVAVRRITSEALLKISDMDSRILPVLIEAMKDEDKHIHDNITMVLYKIGKSAIPAFMQALNDKDKVICRLVTLALDKIGDSSAVPALIQALSINDSLVRKYAIGALVNIGDSSAIPALIQALGDDSNRVRSYAFMELSKIGNSAISELIKALSDENSYVRYNAVGVLREIAAPEALKAVEEYEKREREGTSQDKTIIASGLTLNTDAP